MNASACEVPIRGPEFDTRVQLSVIDEIEVVVVYDSALGGCGTYAIPSGELILTGCFWPYREVGILDDRQAALLRIAAGRRKSCKLSAADPKRTLEFDYAR